MLAAARGASARNRAIAKRLSAPWRRPREPRNAIMMIGPKRMRSPDRKSTIGTAQHATRRQLTPISCRCLEERGVWGTGAGRTSDRAADCRRSQRAATIHAVLRPVQALDPFFHNQVRMVVTRRCQRRRTSNESRPIAKMGVLVIGRLWFYFPSVGVARFELATF